MVRTVGLGGVIQHALGFLCCVVFTVCVKTVRVDVFTPFLCRSVCVRAALIRAVSLPVPRRRL